MSQQLSFTQSMIEKIQQIKLKQIRLLSEQRRDDSIAQINPSYRQVGDFYDGVLDQSGYISPWTKSASNVNSPIMIVAQDWISSGALEKGLNQNLVTLGYDPDLPTNKNLASLLKFHFGMVFQETYATNLFVFVKPGSMSANIPIKLLEYSSEKYTLPEIEIVDPKMVICLGSKTYQVISSSCKKKSTWLPFESKINAFWFKNICVVGVPHAGALGTANAGGKAAVDAIWSEVVEIFTSL